LILACLEFLLAGDWVLGWYGGLLRWR